MQVLVSLRIQDFPTTSKRFRTLQSKPLLRLSKRMGISKVSYPVEVRQHLL